MSSPYKSKAGIQRIWNALFYALDGFAAALKHEDSFRLEVVLALALIPLALSMHIDAVEKHVLAKRAKDLGSAAVMLSIINAVVIWLMVLFGGAWLPH